MLIRLLEKILRIPPVTSYAAYEPANTDLPSWDVPLDQTTSIIRIEGDTLRR